MTRQILALLSITVLGTGGCDSPPTSMVSPYDDRLIVKSSAPLMKVGGQVRFNAVSGLYLTNANASCSWSSSNSAVARVEPDRLPSGIVVTGVSVGAAAITAEKGDQRASWGVRVVADYTGTWMADVRVTACDPLDGFSPGWCDRQAGASYVAGLSIEQNDISVEGRWTILGGSALVRGGFDASGRLQMAAQRIDLAGNLAAVEVSAGTIVLTKWDAESVDSRAMTGLIELEWTLPDQPGRAALRGEIVNAVKR